MTNNALSTVTLCLQGRKQVGGCLARKQQNWGTNLVLQVPRETSGPPPHCTRKDVSAVYRSHFIFLPTNCS